MPCSAHDTLLLDTEVLGTRVPATQERQASGEAAAPPSNTDHSHALFDMNHSSVNARLARDLDNLSYYEKRRHDFDATSAKSRFFHHALQAQHYATFGRIVWRYLPHSTRGNLPSTFKTTSITIMNNAARPVQVLLALSAVVPVLCKQHMLYREGARITSAIKVAQEDRDNVSTPQATDNLDTNPGLRESLVEILQNLQYFLLRQVVFTGPRTDTNSEDAVGWLLDQNMGTG